MADGQRTQISLLTDQKLDIIVQVIKGTNKLKLPPWDWQYLIETRPGGLYLQMLKPFFYFQPKLGVEDLLNIVASHCNLKDPDKQYFALAFLDESQQYQWLQPDRRVLEHEFPKKFTVAGSTLILYHMVKWVCCLIDWTD